MHLTRILRIRPPGLLHISLRAIWGRLYRRSPLCREGILCRPNLLFTDNP